MPIFCRCVGMCVFAWSVGLVVRAGECRLAPRCIPASSKPPPATNLQVAILGKHYRRAAAFLDAKYVLCPDGEEGETLTQCEPITSRKVKRLILLLRIRCPLPPAPSWRWSPRPRASRPWTSSATSIMPASSSWPWAGTPTPRTPSRRWVGHSGEEDRGKAAFRTEYLLARAHVCM